MNSAFLRLTQDELCCWFVCTYSVSCFQVSCAVRGEYASSSSESAWGHEHGNWKPKYHWGVRCCSLPWYYRHITGVQYVKKGRACSQITQVRSPFNISCWSEFVFKTICKIPWGCFPWTRLSRQPVRWLVSGLTSPAGAGLLWEKNTVPWLISPDWNQQANRLK